MHTTPTTSTLFDLVSTACPSAVPYWTGSGDGDSVSVEHHGWVVLATSEGDRWGIGLYSPDAWEAGDSATTIVEAPDRGATAAALHHLMHDQPEGTDWPAWAAQRLDDMGTEWLP